MGQGDGRGRGGAPETGLSESRPSRRAVLWDMDGTLLDSAEYHWLTWKEILAGEGREMTRERFASTFGRRNDAVLRDVFGDEFPDYEIARIAGAKEARYRELVLAGGIEPLPGVRRWLDRLQARGWRQAVASSAPRANIVALLEALGIEDYFAAFAADEDVRHGKPNPEVFLVAASRLGIPPGRCVVVEDAAAGVEAGRLAGMRTIGVGAAHTRLPADLTVASLEDLPDDAFDRLITNCGTSRPPQAVPALITTTYPPDWTEPTPSARPSRSCPACA